MKYENQTIKIDHGNFNLLRLAAKGADETGWAKVSDVVWPLVEKLPDRLVLRAPSDEGGGSVYLTQEAKTLLAWA